MEPFKKKPLKKGLLIRLLGLKKKYNFKTEINNLLAEASSPKDIRKEDIERIMKKYGLYYFPAREFVAVPLMKELFEEYLKYVLSKGEIQEKTEELTYLAELFEIPASEVKSTIESMILKNTETALKSYLSKPTKRMGVSPTQINRGGECSARDIPEMSKCPYCGHELPTPKRKKKCPNCGNYMYVRTKHNLPVDRVVFTEQEAELVDFWENQVCSISFVEDPNEVLKQVYEGDLGKAISDALAILKDKEVWILNIEGERIGKESAYEMVSKLQHQLRMLLYSQTQDKEYKDSAFSTKRESIRRRVLQMKQAGIRKVQIHAVGDRLTCPYCAEQDELVLDIDTFLKTMPVPHPKCSNEKFGCRCTVVAYMEELED